MGLCINIMQDSTYYSCLTWLTCCSNPCTAGKSCRIWGEPAHDTALQGPLPEMLQAALWWLSPLLTASILSRVSALPTWLCSKGQSSWQWNICSTALPYRTPCHWHQQLTRQHSCSWWSSYSAEAGAGEGAGLVQKNHCKGESNNAVSLHCSGQTEEPSLAASRAV